MYKVKIAIKYFLKWITTPRMDCKRICIICKEKKQCLGGEYEKEN